MAKEKMKHVYKGGPTGVFFVAFIGAVVYFIKASNGSFWGVIVGFLKACIWPAFVIYKVLGLLKL